MLFDSPVVILLACGIEKVGVDSGMKRIMFMMTKLGGSGWGGAHKVSVMLANYLAENGYEVFFSVSEHSRVDYPLHGSIKVYCLTDLYKKTHFRMINLMRKCSAYRRLCCKEKIDIVVGFTSNMAIYSVLACLFSKRKSLISERTDPHVEPNNKLLRGLRNIVFCFANAIVFQTPGARDYYPRIVRNRSAIIANPISGTLPIATGEKRDNRIVNFCRIAPQKNLKVLLKAFEIFSETYTDYVLDIYGDANKEGDEYKKEVEKYAKTLTCCSRIRFYPACADVHQKVLNAKMFVSSSDYEGLSNSMLEAMAIGLPVIVTDCANGGERMCIDNGENGIIVSRRDPYALAAAMVKLASDEKMGENISRNAKTIRERFSHIEVFGVWKALIDKM